jgi:hypothetical protein
VRFPAPVIIQQGRRPHALRDSDGILTRRERAQKELPVPHFMVGSEISVLATRIFGNAHLAGPARRGQASKSSSNCINQCSEKSMIGAQTRMASQRGLKPCAGWQLAASLAESAEAAKPRSSRPAKK